MKRLPVDDELDAVRTRREQALDLLVQSLIEVDNCTLRIDVLLDRRAAEVARDRMA